MGDPDLLAALRPVLNALDRLRVRHYVGGSIASSAHGVARSSLDADVVAELRPEHVDPLIRALREAYYVPEGRVHDATLRRASFVIHLETMMKVDVFVARDRPFDRRAMDRARTSPSLDGRPLPIASPEDTVLAKLEWYRRGREVSERQWTDVLGVLRVSGPGMDREYLREGARELTVEDLLDRALRESGVC